MNNFTEHIINQPLFAAIIICSLLIILACIPYFLNQQKRYGSLIDFASQSRKVVAGSALITLIGATVYGLTPYVPPPTDEVALVIGNTQNTPAPSISEDISEIIRGTMLQHKGDDAYELADSIKIISATKEPEVIDLDVTSMKLREIGNNNSNAKRSAEINIKALSEKIESSVPKDNGANYLEAILKARDNVKEGSRILVIGSGLSDSGELNFSMSNILTNEQTRNDVLGHIKEKYGNDYMEGFSVDFYGLGDSTPPQEPLSTKQKEIVREIYRRLIRDLGGSVDIHTKTLLGGSVETTFVVGTTDTGCGDIDLVFDDNNLKFISNEATFTDNSTAKQSLMTVKEIWDDYRDNIQSIQVDGYIAHYPGPDDLSQKRADLVKKVLIDLGISPDRIIATGRGFGPYEQDTQNRIVKVNISRQSDVCVN